MPIIENWHSMSCTLEVCCNGDACFSWQFLREYPIWTVLNEHFLILFCSFPEQITLGQFLHECLFFWVPPTSNSQQQAAAAVIVPTHYPELTPYQLYARGMLQRICLFFMTVSNIVLLIFQSKSPVDSFWTNVYSAGSRQRQTHNNKQQQQILLLLSIQSHQR